MHASQRGHGGFHGYPATSRPHSAVSGSSSVTRWQSSSNPSASRRGVFRQSGCTPGVRAGAAPRGWRGAVRYKRADELVRDTTLPEPACHCWRRMSIKLRPCRQAEQLGCVGLNLVTAVGQIDDDRAGHHESGRPRGHCHRRTRPPRGGPPRTSSRVRGRLACPLPLSLRTGVEKQIERAQGPPEAVIALPLTSLRAPGLTCCAWRQNTPDPRRDRVGSGRP
jgi:hypothetical protein